MFKTLWKFLLLICVYQSNLSCTQCYTTKRIGRENNGWKVIYISDPPMMRPKQYVMPAKNHIIPHVVAHRPSLPVMTATAHLSPVQKQQQSKLMPYEMFTYMNRYKRQPPFGLHLTAGGGGGGGGGAGAGAPMLGGDWRKPSPFYKTPHTTPYMSSLATRLMLLNNMAAIKNYEMLLLQRLNATEHGKDAMLATKSPTATNLQSDIQNFRPNDRINVVVHQHDDYINHHNNNNNNHINNINHIKNDQNNHYDKNNNQIIVSTPTTALVEVRPPPFREQLMKNEFRPLLPHYGVSGKVDFHAAPLQYGSSPAYSISDSTTRSTITNQWQPQKQSNGHSIHSAMSNFVPLYASGGSNVLSNVVDHDNKIRISQKHDIATKNNNTKRLHNDYDVTSAEANVDILRTNFQPHSSTNFEQFKYSDAILRSLKSLLNSQIKHPRNNNLKIANASVLENSKISVTLPLAVTSVAPKKKYRNLKLPNKSTTFTPLTTENNAGNLYESTQQTQPTQPTTTTSSTILDWLPNGWRGIGEEYFSKPPRKYSVTPPTTTLTPDHSYEDEMDEEEKANGLLHQIGHYGQFTTPLSTAAILVLNETTTLTNIFTTLQPATTTPTSSINSASKVSNISNSGSPKKQYGKGRYQTNTANAKDGQMMRQITATTTNANFINTNENNNSKMQKILNATNKRKKLYGLRPTILPLKLKIPNKNATRRTTTTTTTTTTASPPTTTTTTQSLASMNKNQEEFDDVKEEETNHKHLHRIVEEIPKSKEKFKRKTRKDSKRKRLPKRRKSVEPNQDGIKDCNKSNIETCSSVVATEKTTTTSTTSRSVVANRRRIMSTTNSPSSSSSSSSASPLVRRGTIQYHYRSNVQTERGKRRRIPTTASTTTKTITTSGSTTTTTTRPRTTPSTRNTNISIIPSTMVSIPLKTSTDISRTGSTTVTSTNSAATLMSSASHESNRYNSDNQMESAVMKIKNTHYNSKHKRGEGIKNTNITTSSSSSPLITSSTTTAAALFNTNRQFPPALIGLDDFYMHITATTVIPPLPIEVQFRKIKYN